MNDENSKLNNVKLEARGSKLTACGLTLNKYSFYV